MWVGEHSRKECYSQPPTIDKGPMTNKIQISAELVMILAGYVSDSFSGIQHPLIYQLLIGLAVCLLIVALFS
jgi:hypothetical protein